MDKCTKIMTVTVISVIVFAVQVHAEISSGIYGSSIFISVNNKEKFASGYFSSGVGDFFKNQWQCRFYFSGRLMGNSGIKIIASMKDPVAGVINTKGTIWPGSDFQSLTLRLDEEIPGCERDETLSGSELPGFRLDEKKDFLEFRIVGSNRSYFYDSQTAERHRKGYVTCGDIVRVLDKTASKTRKAVEYKGAGKVSRGWLAEKDLVPLGQPLKCH